MARHKPTSSKPVSPAEEAAIAHGPDPLPDVSPRVEAEVKRLSKTIRRYVRRDILEQRAAVERLLIEGAKARQITRILRAQWPLITARTVELRISQVEAERRAEYTFDRAKEREFAVERLQAMRQRALAGQRPDYKAAVACEKEIAKILGLYAPTKVDVSGELNHSHAMMSVIANMDPELAAEMLQEAKEEKRLAAKARELLPGIVDVPAASEK